MGNRPNRHPPTSRSQLSSCHRLPSRHKSPSPLRQHTCQLTSTRTHHPHNPPPILTAPSAPPPPCPRPPPSGGAPPPPPALSRPSQQPERRSGPGLGWVGFDWVGCRQADGQTIARPITAGLPAGWRLHHQAACPASLTHPLRRHLGLVRGVQLIHHPCVLLHQRRRLLLPPAFSECGGEVSK